MRPVVGLMRALGNCRRGEDAVEKIVAHIERGDKAHALEEFAEHRKNLLDDFHRCDRRILCVDFIASEIEKA